MMFLPLKNRDEFPSLLKSLGLNGIGVEVGAGSGCFSERLLENSDLDRLFSVDPWNSDDPENTEYQNKMQLDGQWYLECVKRLSRFRLRSAVLRMTSFEAADWFQDKSLDFVYIDANHDYDYIRKDLVFWWPKVKIGGVFAGHDYCQFHWGVPKAVDEFAAEMGLTLHVTELDMMFQGHEIRSWYFLKT